MVVVDAAVDADAAAAVADVAISSALDGHSTSGAMTLVGDAWRGVIDCGVALAGVLEGGDG